MPVFWLLQFKGVPDASWDRFYALNAPSLYHRKSDEICHNH